jgi:HAD superfamily hydrolase (TIGR01509 family)
MYERTVRAFDRELKAVDGVTDAIARIPCKICVASSSTPERIERSLRVTGLWKHFHPHIFSATQVSRGKPAPDLFLFAAERMETPPAECVVIEDSPAGIEAARAAKMYVIGFTGGAHCTPAHPGMLRAAGAMEILSSMRGLRKVLGLD